MQIPRVSRGIDATLMKAIFRILPFLSAIWIASFAGLAQTDGPLPVYKLAIIQPKANAMFPAGSPIPIVATAVSSGEAAYTLDFLADGHFIGRSHIDTLVAVPPGVPVRHEFVWNGAAPGIHALTVRHIDASGNLATSDPTKVNVLKLLTGGPSLVWLGPLPGDTVKTPGIVPLVVTTFDPLSEIRRVEFHEGTVLIGVAEILTKDAIFPGRPRTLTWPWTNPPAGPHAVVATAVSADGTKLESAWKFLVQGSTDTPVATVFAEKANASESGDLKSRALIFRFALSAPAAHDLAVFYSLGGTATPGLDYVALAGPNGPFIDPTTLLHVLMPAGQTGTTVTFWTVADSLAEGTETVELKLVDSPSAGILPTYVLGDPARARGEIIDGPVIDPATITWIHPANGARFPVGTPIELKVTARDPAGLLTHVDFLAGDRLIGGGDWSCITCKMAPGAELPISFVWKDAPAGIHTLHAEGIDAAGTRVTSAPITIVVEDIVPPKGAAIRHLPASAAGGTAFAVTIDVTPAPGTQAWVILDHPPFLHEGGAVPPPDMPWWHVTGVDDGVFDGPNRAVKFGPFFGDAQRTLTYHVTPNDAWVDQAVFDGEYVADGNSAPIGGDLLIQGGRRHPADIAPADDRITAEELTSYAAAWRSGKAWAGGTIPMDFVTRAGELWSEGETYRFDPSAGPAPLWWVSAPLLVPSTGGDASAGTGPARPPRHSGLATASWTPGTNGSASILELRLIPGPTVSAQALEVRVATKPSTITADGSYDAGAGVVRWGPFTDGNSRTMRCTFADAGKATLSGRASFDGRPVALVKALATTGGSGGPRLVAIGGMEGGMEIVAEDPAAEPGATLRLEYSTDLKHWAPLGDFTNGSAASFAHDALPATDVPRFYRATRQ